MDSFLFACNAVAPIVIVVAIGYLLKRAGIIDGSFVKLANRLVFHVFLPAKLFLNIYRIETVAEIELDYVVYASVAVLTVFLLALPAVLLIVKKQERRGALWQATFRSNYALVGIPLTESLFGEAGATVATLLSAPIIPLLNILAVISLSVFRNDGKKPSVRKILLGILKNPLIQSVLIGLFVVALRPLAAELGISYRLSNVTPLFKALDYLGVVATPLALICLGAQFEFSAVKSLRREITFGVLMRTVIVPVLGIGTAYAFFRNSFTGAHFAAFIAVFATPVSISSVPMAQEMDADVTLAGQLVIWSTILSAISIFLISFFLREVGIF